MRGQEVDLAIGHIGTNPRSRKSRKVEFYVAGDARGIDTSYLVREAWTYDQSFNLPSQRIPRTEIGLAEWSFIKDLDIPDVLSSQITVLIGSNCKALMRQEETRVGPPEFPDAILTPLGWTLCGTYELAPNDESPACVNYCVMSTSQSADPILCQDIHSLVERLWSTESFGCQYDYDVPQSAEDRRAMELLEGTCRMIEGHYEIGMLWKNDHVVLPENKSQCENRFLLQRKRLLKDPTKHEAYCRAVQKNLDKGYATRSDTSRPPSVRDHWLPQHLVFSPTKTEPRVVFDGGAQCKGTSLNSNLLKGPDGMTGNLHGILLRCRRGDIILSADVEGMFNQVKVPVTDRRALKFLYTASPIDPPDEYEMNVHIFGATDSPCCANYALKRCALDNVCEYSDTIISAILRDFYVDDLLHSLDGEDAAVNAARSFVKCLGTGSFVLTKWVSNNRTVLETVSETNSNISVQIDLDLDHPPPLRVLGIRLDFALDCFLFLAPKIPLCTTKRQMLSAVCSLFDPLGVLLPYTLRAKLLLQRLWRVEGLDWDMIIPPDVQRVWNDWTSELDLLSKFTQERKYWPIGMKPIELSLHIFCDASESAFCSVAYIRAQLNDQSVHVSFVYSRARVAPCKKSKLLTVPRLELQAAVLGSRLYLFLKSELGLKPDYVMFWSDSQIVLHYLRSETLPLKTFVANRVAEILSATKEHRWHFLPGIDNPADDGTRGVHVASLTAAKSRWLNGPGFLSGPVSAWPEDDFQSCFRSDDLEVRQVHLVTRSEPEIQTLFDSEEVSTLFRLLCITAYCLRFAHNTRRRIPTLNGLLSVHEIRAATILWIRAVQEEAYLPELSAARNDSAIPRSSKLLMIRPIMVNGVLRVGGRLDRAVNLSYDARHQFILPKNHRFSLLLVADAHVRFGHTNLSTTMAQVRQSYWIPQLRSLVKKVLKSCLSCERLNTQPIIPMMSELPEARTAVDQPPWSFCGVDYFGPIWVKFGRRRSKRWVALFTCLTFRGIHLEIVSSLEASEFINAYRRFLARRGPVIEMWSDNGTSFVGALKELRQSLDCMNANPSLRNLMLEKIIMALFASKGS